MDSLILTSISSWLTNTKWLTPLAASVTAIAAVGTVIAAVYIGHQASKVSKGQKEITGLAEVNKLMEKYDSPRFQFIRRRVATSYLSGTPDDPYMYEILNFIEELSMYVTRDFISLDVVEELLSFSILCSWYAALPLVEPYREEMKDGGIWIGAEELVNKLHASSKKQGVEAWARPPDIDQMRSYFQQTLRTSEQLERDGLWQSPNKGQWQLGRLSQWFGVRI